jgi:competence ComEA-like helix-hairpin-helix protein
MNVNINIFNNLIKRWDNTIEWTESELKTIRAILENISLNNGGRVKYDVELEEKIENEYVINAINTAMQKVMNLYAESIKQEYHKYYYVHMEGVKPALDFFAPVKYVPKIDINRADTTELANLPGIGPKTAQRIIEYRNENGFFTDISEVLRVKGIDREDFNKFKYSISARPIRNTVNFLSPLLLEFKSNPTFSNYLKLIKSSRGRFVMNEKFRDEKGFKDIILTELRKIDDYIKKNHYHAFNKYRRKKASHISEVFEQHQYVKDMEERASYDIKGGCVIDDEEYLYFIKRLIADAKEKIRIIMFFMRFEDEKKYPTDPLFNELKAAKERGVDIKVILDKDAEGQIFGSRVINEEAYNFFKNNGIEVTYDFDQELTHTKLVLVDDRHLVIGSHNWTAGSFFAYDDNSVYIESFGLTDETSKYFDRLWVEYTTGSNAKFQRIRDLEEIGKTYAPKLEKEGVFFTLDFLLKTKLPKDRKVLSEKTGIPYELLLKWANLADLMRIRGINEEFAILLEELGVGMVPELAQRKPENLYYKIDEVCISKPYIPKPSLEDVTSWIEQAKNLNRIILEY